MLRAYPGAFAAIGTAPRHVESPDDVKHIFLKGIGVGLAGHARGVVVKDALDTGAGRAHVAAGIAADALG